MKKVITALILCSSNMVGAQISMELDGEITENILTPVNSLVYDISSKDVVVETKYPIICNDLNSPNTPSDTSIKLIDPNGAEQARVSLDGEPGSANYQLSSKIFTAKTNEISVINNASNLRANDTLQQSLEVFHNICLTYNKHEEIFNSNMESSPIYSEEYLIREPTSLGWQNRLSLKITIDKNLDSPLDRIYLNSSDFFEYTITVKNLSGSQLQGLSLKEFVPYDNSLPSYFDTQSCVIDGSPQCVGDLPDFSLGTSVGIDDEKTFSVTRSPINFSNSGATYDSLQMMLALYMKSLGGDGFVLLGSVDVNVEVEHTQ